MLLRIYNRLDSAGGPNPLGDGDGVLSSEDKSWCSALAPAAHLSLDQTLLGGFVALDSAAVLILTTMSGRFCSSWDSFPRGSINSGQHRRCLSSSSRCMWYA